MRKPQCPNQYIQMLQCPFMFDAKFKKKKKKKEKKRKEKCEGFLNSNDFFEAVNQHKQKTFQHFFHSKILL